MAILVKSPFNVYTDINGEPVEDGYIYIGITNMNPIVSPLAAYWDEALTIPATNIRTKGGYPSLNGSPGQIYVATDYSFLLHDKKGLQVLYSPAREDPVITDTELETFVDNDIISPPLVHLNAILDTSGGDSTFTLGNGTFEGQRVFFLISGSGKATLVGVTPSIISQTPGTAQFTWVNGGWESLRVAEAYAYSVAVTGSIPAIAQNISVFSDTTAGNNVLALPDPLFLGQYITTFSSAANVTTLTHADLAFTLWVSVGQTATVRAVSDGAGGFTWVPDNELTYVDVDGEYTTSKYSYGKQTVYFQDSATITTSNLAIIYYSSTVTLVYPEAFATVQRPIPCGTSVAGNSWQSGADAESVTGCVFKAFGTSAGQTHRIASLTEGTYA